MRTRWNNVPSIVPSSTRARLGASSPCTLRVALALAILKMCLSFHVYCLFCWNVSSSPVILAGSWLPAFGARLVRGTLPRKHSVCISVVAVQLGRLRPFSCLAPSLDCEPLESSVCLVPACVPNFCHVESHTVRCLKCLFED